MQGMGPVKGCREQAAPPAGELFDKFSQATLTELRSMMHVVSYPAGSVLFSRRICRSWCMWFLRAR